MCTHSKLKQTNSAAVNEIQELLSAIASQSNLLKHHLSNFSRLSQWGKKNNANNCKGLQRNSISSTSGVPNGVKDSCVQINTKINSLVRKSSAAPQEVSCSERVP